MREWLTIDQVEELTGWSKRHIRRLVGAGRIRARNGEAIARNGKSEREYAASSLPAETQLKLVRLSLPASSESAALAITAPPGQARLFAQMPAVRPEDRANLAPAQSAQAQSRLEVIAPLIDYAHHRKRERKEFHTLGGRAVKNLTSLAEYVAEQHHLSPRTLWKWYSRYRKFGYAGLADRPRADKGRSRFLAAHPAARAFVETKYLRERLSIRLVHQAVLREWARLADRDEKPPSYSTVRAYLEALPKPLVILSRRGERQFKERCEPYLLTDFGSIGVNQIWVSDHVKHDLWVRSDLFRGTAPNTAIRPWLTAILDMRSRKVVGTAWSAFPNSHTITSALRAAIQQHGIPETLYIDNGRDFEKVGKIDFSPECSGVLIRLGIKPQYCLPKHPQSKLIESWFATLHKRFDSLWPSYCGPNSERRPEQCDLLLKEHQAFLKGKRESSSLPPTSEFVQMAAQWVGDYNAQHPHSGRAMKGRTPDEVFNELLPPAARRTVKDQHVLDALFWDRQRRKVMEGGCVQLYGQRYEPANAESFGKLFLQIEREIVVACDPANLGEAIALDFDGHFLGHLRAQGLLVRGPVSYEDVKASMRLRRSARRAVSEYVRGLAVLRSRAGDISELELLRQRTGPQAPGNQKQKLSGAGRRRRESMGTPGFIDDIVSELSQGE
ncbi:MAG: DDE-type integrase/transposase/recombinase [Acidobacteriota bacterium]|nr:DDE-type integrase/transposase/recombinase [Acidobacteriota bacterium]